MPDSVVAAAIEPVVATPGGDGKGSATGQKETKGAKQHDSPLDRVFAELGINEDGSSEEMPTLSDITRKVEAKEKKPEGAQAGGERSKEAAVAAAEEPEAAPAEEQAEEPAPKLKKYNVGGKTYELTEDQADRFAQKGIHYEKQGVEIVKMQRQLEAGLSQMQQERQQHQGLLKALMERPGEVLEAFHGKEAFKKIEPWAGDKVMQEMEYEKNPHLRAIHDAEARAQAAEARAQSLEQQTQERAIDQQSNELAQKYQQVILQALETGGIPKTDYTARDMVVEMKRAIAAGVDHTPQQLAEIVKSDNTERSRALTEAIGQQIEAARQANDQASIVKLGGQLVDMFGEPVVYAIAKYHLAKMRSSRPNQPRQIVETQRVQPTDKNGWGKNGRQYMSEDDYADMRRKIASGQMEPPPGW